MVQEFQLTQRPLTSTTSSGTPPGSETAMAGQGQVPDGAAPANNGALAQNAVPAPDQPLKVFIIAVAAQLREFSEIVWRKQGAWSDALVPATAGMRQRLLTACMVGMHTLSTSYLLVCFAISECSKYGYSKAHESQALWRLLESAHFSKEYSSCTGAAGHMQCSCQPGNSMGCRAAGYRRLSAWQRGTFTGPCHPQKH